MDKLIRELQYGLMYAKTNLYKNRLRITTQSIERMLQLTVNPYLALSFGKQSIILAHIIYKLRPETKMIFLRSWETYYLHNYEQIIKEFTDKYPINLHIHYKDNVSWNDMNWKETRDFGSKDIQNMAEEAYPEWDGVIMGLSKDESVARRITCSSSNTDWKTIFQYTSGKYRCTPIQFWDKNDILAYISTNELPLLNAYHEKGIETRTTARITRNCAEMNGLVDIKKRDISNYNRIVKRFPELSAKA